MQNTFNFMSDCTANHCFSVTSYIRVNTGDVRLFWWTLCPLGSGWGSALHTVGWSEQTIQTHGTTGSQKILGRSPCQDEVWR